MSSKNEIGRFSNGDCCSEECGVSMRNSTIITGIFNGDANVAQCLQYLCRQSIAVEKISVFAAESSNLRVVARRLFAVRLDTGKVISIVGLSGSIAGVLVAMCARVMSPPWELLPELGMLGSLALGAVLGRMCGTLIGCVVASVVSSFPRNLWKGRLARNQVAITVQVQAQSPEKNAIRAIMQEFGTVVTVGQESPTLRKIDPPPVSLG
jgi:hypothetical protein